ncbi:MAG: hypothetical protein HZC14_02310 [Candidatus Niyogibacteria bacterium]|nr:hypothetical protein [Candidatus Niyogibacteria bacterium]
MFGKRPSQISRKELAAALPRRRVVQDILPAYPAGRPAHSVGGSSSGAPRQDTEKKLLEKRPSDRVVLTKFSHGARKILEAAFRRMGELMTSAFKRIALRRSDKKTADTVKTNFSDGMSGDADRVLVKKTRARQAILLGVFLIIVAGGWLFLKFFAYVTIKITPRQRVMSVDMVFKGSKNSAADFPLEVVSFKRMKEISGETTGLSDVNARAHGKIMIYNAYSSEPQVLSRRTRFETPDGKIFRTAEVLTVPGAEIKNGQIAPSSIEAEVLADQPGEKYNIGLTDFTIPGFKGTARFTKFYGRSVKPMEGGFVGTARIVAKEDVDSMTATLKKQLDEDIYQEYDRQITDGFVILDGAREVSYDAPVVSPSVTAVGDSVSVKLASTFQGIIVKESDIASVVATAYLGKDAEKNIEIVNFQDLAKDVVSKDFGKGEISVRIKGMARFAWPFDEAGIRKDFLAGDKSMNEIFDSYNGIERAEMAFWPSWWKFMPTKADKIKILRALTP